MSSQSRKLTGRRVIYSLLLLALAVAAFDYAKFHSRNRRALNVVSRLNGRAGSLLDWPFGKEYVIVFDRLLSNAELQQLSEPNSLVGRNHVTVYFDCDLTVGDYQADFI